MSLVLLRSRRSSARAAFLRTIGRTYEQCVSVWTSLSLNTQYAIVGRIYTT